MLTMHRSILPLLAGCAVLVKPSEVTPRFVAPLMASMVDVPELAAVFDFVLGDAVTGAALIDQVVALANDTDFGLSAAVIAGTDAEAIKIASRINAGNVSVQDSFLTFAAAPAESDSFGASGLGGKRTGIQRYLKRQALLHNMARPVCLTEPARMAAE